MPARAYWKGYLRLSLVTIGVELYSATTLASSLSLHQIHKPTGKRIRYQKIAPGVGPVDTDDIVKGYATGKDEYVILDPDEIDDIKLETRRTIELVQFVEYGEIDPRYFEKPYYVIPVGDEVAAQGFAVIREALRKAKRVALGQMAVRGRDYIVAIKPCGEGLLLETLRYAEEIRESDQVFDLIPDAKLDKEMLELAGELIDRKTAPFEAEKFKSEYTNALRDLIEEKRKTGTVSDVDEGQARQSGGQVIDLMEALKKSVAKGSKKTPSKSKSASKSKSSGGRKKAG
ncbi:MAG: Ku protein [Maricaulis sp.]|jgi:DNA end-binding protein Ku|nr:Ku protein [Maricaulis sp.]HAQ36336.1 Ku protein [Alphaproteobacteria bacterium]|tara:strand:- start:734 stop:1594 length:861 start_codon:yes stop_codon:yes gene_type:complete